MENDNFTSFVMCSFFVLVMFAMARLGWELMGRLF
jgi:hypothetical protein